MHQSIASKVGIIAHHWLIHSALVLTLILALFRAGSASLIPFALVIGVLAVLQASILAQPTTDTGLEWGALFKHLLGPSVLPVYGLAAAGMLYLDKGGAGCGGSGGCTSCGGGGNVAVAPAKLAPPSMCGGGCGSGGAGCGSGGCGKAGGGCGSGCGAGKKAVAANAKGVKNVNIPPPRTNLNAPVPAGANLPGMNGPNAKPLPPGLVPKGGVELPVGVAPAGSEGQRAKGGEVGKKVEESGEKIEGGGRQLPVGGASEVSGETPGSMPRAPSTPPKAPVKIPPATIPLPASP